MAELAGPVTEIPLKALVYKKDTQVAVLNRDITGKMVDYLIKIQPRNVEIFFIGHNLYMKVFNR